MLETEQASATGARSHPRPHFRLHLFHCSLRRFPLPLLLTMLKATQCTASNIGFSFSPPFLKRFLDVCIQKCDGTIGSAHIIFGNLILAIRNRQVQSYGENQNSSGLSGCSWMR